MKTSDLQLRTLTKVMDLLGRHPIAVRMLLRPLANAPLLSKHWMVLPRAIMGASAFEIHDVDLKTGRIGIGGVEEVMAGAKLIHLLHEKLGARLGDEAKNEALYELGCELCQWEVSQALENGRWAPAALVPLIHNARILDEVQENPHLAAFFTKTMEMMSRLITNEGGWGHLDFDFSSWPLRVYLSHSQEARWLGPAPAPVCHFYAGIVAGYASTISGQALSCREVSCAASGAPRCLFELERAAAGERAKTAL